MHKVISITNLITRCTFYVDHKLISVHNVEKYYCVTGNIRDRLTSCVMLRLYYIVLAIISILNDEASNERKKSPLPQPGH